MVQPSCAPKGPGSECVRGGDAQGQVWTREEPPRWIVFLEPSFEYGAQEVSIRM